ncbi:TolC family protein [Rhodobacteraceae bacterium XHP0102]|nr:TolC family protein [Rhodobacteraceae bacterium XHP0102]
MTISGKKPVFRAHRLCQIGVILGLSCLALSGCVNGPRPTPLGGEGAAMSAQYVMGGSYQRDWRAALRGDTALGRLADEAEALSIARSPTVFELRAAEAESAAEASAWFPRIRPVATAGAGAVSSGVGISVTQLIYDFAQTRTRREQAEIARAVTEIDFWAERNDDVRDALTTYIAAIETNEIIATRRDLEQRLVALAALEAERREAGVTGQGDSLFLDITRQENRRELIRAEARLVDAQAQLLRDTGVNVTADAGLRFAAVEAACSTPAPRPYSPELMRARLAVELAAMEEEEARRSLFPTVTGAADLRTGRDGAPSDNARVTLEGGTLAGGGGRFRIEAAEQLTLAASQEFENLDADLTRELDRLSIEKRALTNTLRDYQELVRATEASLGLFEDRFAAGAASISEAVRLEVERSANLVAIAETRADLVGNCLEAARVFGALAPAELRAGSQ